MAKDEKGYGSEKRAAGFDRLAAEMRKTQPKQKPAASAKKSERDKAFDRLAREMRKQGY